MKIQQQVITATSKPGRGRAYIRAKTAVRDYTPSPLLSLKFLQKRVGLFSQGYGNCIPIIYTLSLVPPNTMN